MSVMEFGKVLETMTIRLMHGGGGAQPKFDTKQNAAESKAAQAAADRRKTERALKEAITNAEECKAMGELHSAGNYYILASQLAMDLGFEGEALGFDIKARQCYGA